jgi:hypothetical protein
MQSRRCITCFVHRLHVRAPVFVWGKGMLCPPPPLLFTISQLIPGVIQQRRLCFGLRVLNEHKPAHRVPNPPSCTPVRVAIADTVEIK